VSLYEKMVCQTEGCKHNRYEHRRKPTEKYTTISGPCGKRTKEGPCSCIEFTEPE
jgi:hypothetical protein